MKLYYPGYMVNNKQMELYSQGYIERKQQENEAVFLWVHRSAIVYPPGEYSVICLLLSIHPEEYSFICLLSSIHREEYSFICLLLSWYTPGEYSFICLLFSIQYMVNNKQMELYSQGYIERKQQENEAVFLWVHRL
jgi:sulfur relay (sulfurtransferase) DsrC/TusE family protein